MSTDTYTVVDNMTDKNKKKILARIPVIIRPARPMKNKDETPPLIVSVPRSIANAAHVHQKDQYMMFTDGDMIYLRRIDLEPEI